jgi:ACT domain-containing protein
MSTPEPVSIQPENSGKELSFITVIGHDQKGIVARISNLLYQKDINIEDIAQKVMHGHFVMIMMVDFKDSRSDLEDIKAGLEKVAAEMGLQIQIQHEELFKMINRV